MSQQQWGSSSGGAAPYATERQHQPSTSIVTEVQIDGAALLRIVKHCEDSLPTPSTGALLGLEIPRGEGQGSVLQVTYAFALPRGGRDTYGDRDGEEGDDEERNERERSHHQRDMMKHLKEVNVDANMVGWYRTMQLGHFSEPGMKTDAAGLRSQRTLFDVPGPLADELPENSVVILYDPVQTAMGSLTVKAYRHLPQPTTPEETQALSSFRDLLEEIPVVVRNPGIVSALLFDLQYDSQLKCDYQKLDLSSGPYLAKNVELMMEEVDRMTNQMERIRRFQSGGGRPIRDNRWNRRREDEEDRNVEPSRVDTVLSATQIGTYCSQVSKFNKSGFSKLFLVGSLHSQQGQPSSAGGMN